MTSQFHRKPPEISITKLNNYNYEVCYDKDVRIGLITRQGSHYVFFPEDLDGLSGRTLGIITKKVDWLDSQIYTTRYFT